jgi:hypothetical protein
MVAAFTWQKTSGAPALFVVRGDVTESSDFAGLQRELEADNELDLAGVSYVNSRGVREWLAFVQAVMAAGQRLVLHRCSPPFVNQLNMISRFIGDAKIRSILVPYACPQCGELTERLFDLKITDVNLLLATPLSCLRCGTTMVFDDLPGAYFAFLKEQSARPQ